MAKKTEDTDALILEAMERALADPRPRKLHGTKANPGVFLSSNAASKTAAKRCVEDRLIEMCGEASGKSARAPLFTIAPAGIRFLIDNDPPQRLLAATQASVDVLTTSMKELHGALAHLANRIETLSRTLKAAAESVKPPDVNRLLASLDARESSPPKAGVASESHGGLRASVLASVRDHQRQEGLRPIDLPSLYRAVRVRCPSTSVGQFHDVLRQLVASREIRLSPFTQAMYQLPEPEMAVIVGREVMYYAVDT